MLQRHFPVQSGASGQIVFNTEHGTVTDPANRRAITASLAQMGRGADVTAVTDPFDPRTPTISPDHRTAFATVNYSRLVLKSVHSNQALAAAGTARRMGVDAEVTGSIAQTNKIEGKEGIGLAVAVIVLLVAFGSLIAMGIPVGTALIGLVIGLGAVGVIAGFVDVPTTSPMLASMIGLGVGIDYALFVVTRHRQHLAEGMTPVDAAGKANATAGQSVLFAGTTVVIAICGLVMSGIPSVTLMGFSAGIVVIVAMIVAVTLLPALLGLVGTRIDQWSVPHRHAELPKARQTLSARWAHHVGHRPWRYALVSLTALIALAAPVLGLRIGFADDSNASARSTEHRVRPARCRVRQGLQRPADPGRRAAPRASTAALLPISPAPSPRRPASPPSSLPSSTPPATPRCSQCSRPRPRRTPRRPAR
jgi:RND superfamily putative drug exporter